MKNKPELLVLLVAVLALAAKLYCASTTLGTVDFLLCQRFGHFIAQHGVLAIYPVDPLFNHPPLLGNYMGLAYEWAQGSQQWFGFFIRLPGILADFSVILMLLWVRRKTGRPPIWALTLLAASPVCFMISGYHGNFDSLIACGLVLVAVACLRGQALLAGVCLGLACQVKIIPLIMAPALFFFWCHRGKGLPFAAATVVTLFIGWSAPLLSVPQTFLHQVLSYNSTWGWWGITYLLNLTGLPALQGIVSVTPLSLPQVIIVQALKITVVVGTLVLSWRRRRGEAVDLPATMGLVWALLFTLAPGFGVQYLAWVSPFILLYSPRWFAAFTVCGSVGLFVFYNTISGGIPWEKGVGLSRLFGIWGPWLLLPWAVFAALLISSRREFGLGKKAPAEVVNEEARPGEALEPV